MWGDTNQTEYWWNLTKTVYLCVNWGILMDFSIRLSYFKMCSKQPQSKCPLFPWNTSGAKKSMGVRDRQCREQLTSCVPITQATGDSKMLVNQLWKKKGKRDKKKSKRGKREGREGGKEKFLCKWKFKFLIQAVLVLFLVYEFLKNSEKKKFYISMGVTNKKIQGKLTQNQWPSSQTAVCLNGR